MQTDKIIGLLLKNRGLTSPEAVEGFFHPPHPKDLSLKSSGLSASRVTSAIRLIRSHIQQNHPIAVYGDYDVDGICATAVIWETLHAHSPHVFPHIPHRKDEGYGLTQKGIDHCLSQDAKLIITVDNGIVAHEQIEYCRSRGCDVIVIDHHEPVDTLPKANVLLHSTATTATGLSWFFSREFQNSDQRPTNNDQLSLVSLATICDIVPLMGLNRSLAKFGLIELNQTRRPGLLALFRESGLTAANDQRATINSYHVGFIIGPRLNAMGRLEHALDSLRLLCTTDPDRAAKLAVALNDTNRSRQDLTVSAFTHAQTLVDENNLPSLIIVADTSYDQGIIGLIAARLVEKYHRPAIAVSIGEAESKASARSVAGFNITDHIRTAGDLLTSVGGHAMAAGFSFSNAHLEQVISALSHPEIDPDLFVKSRRIDVEAPLSAINLDLYLRLLDFEPYGLGNPQPVFSTSNIQITNIRYVGRDNQHLKFKVDGLDAIYFNAPSAMNDELIINNPVNLVYRISLDTFNRQSHIQLVVQDIIPVSSPTIPLS